MALRPLIPASAGRLKKIAPEQTPDKDDGLARTPPYVTAKPEVTYRKLTRGDQSGDLRFIVMATDGCELVPAA